MTIFLPIYFYQSRGIKSLGISLRCIAGWSAYCSAMGNFAKASPYGLQPFESPPPWRVSRSLTRFVPVLKRAEILVFTEENGN